MKAWNKDVPKLKKGAWFVKVRHSYLPMTLQAWLLHGMLIVGATVIIYSAYNDRRSLPVMIVTMLLQLIGLGTIFTYIASKKA